MDDEKRRLRADLLAARRARSAADLESARAAIRGHLAARTAAVVAAYVPMRTEPGSVELLAQLSDAGAQVLVPVVLADQDLDWARWRPGGAGAAGVAGEPLGVDAIGTAELVLVPALAVATDGTRLGRGGGSYDRALRRVAETTPTVALLFDGELVAELPRAPWDVPVRAVVTPADGWLDLPRRNTGVGPDR